MFLVRDIVLMTDDNLVNDQRFWPFWLGTAGVALLCSLLALWQKQAVYATVTVGVGSYVFASSIAGIMLVSGVAPIRFRWFCLIFIAGAIAGVITHLMVPTAQPLSMRTKLVGMPGLPAMKPDPSYGSVFA